MKDKLLQKIFIRIWVVHQLLYYTLYGELLTIPNIKVINSDTFLATLLWPLAGMIGFLDSFPGFFILPILFMLLLTEYFQLKIFKAYIISVFTCHILRFSIQRYLYYTENYNDLILDSKPMGSLYSFIMLIIALIVTGYLNYLFNKKLIKASTLRQAQADQN